MIIQWQADLVNLEKMSKSFLIRKYFRNLKTINV